MHMYTQGEIKFNGRKVKEEDIANTGYVLQLARPYYEELTARENLTLATQMKLPSSSQEKKLERVKKVIKMVKLLCYCITMLHK